MEIRREINTGFRKKIKFRLDLDLLDGSLGPFLPMPSSKRKHKGRTKQRKKAYKAKIDAARGVYGTRPGLTCLQPFCQETTASGRKQQLTTKNNRKKPRI